MACPRSWKSLVVELCGLCSCALILNAIQQTSSLGALVGVRIARSARTPRQSAMGRGRLTGRKLTLAKRNTVALWCDSRQNTIWANSFPRETTTMTSASRRRFLRQTASVGMACSADLLFGRPLFGQTSAAPAATRIYVDSRRTIAPLDRNLFGSFLEHHAVLLRFAGGAPASSGRWSTFIGGG